MSKPQEVTTILYTVESEESAEQAKAELRREDPTLDRAVAVLSGSQTTNLPQKDSTDEPKDR